MGLNQPLAGAMLTDPDGGGVIIVALALGFVLSAAVEGADGVIGGQCRVRREDADLEIAKLVRLKLAVLQVNQKSVDCLDVVIHFDEIFGEEIAHGGEVAFSHRGPEMLLEIDDFDWGWSWVRRLCGGGHGECQKEEEGTHAAMVASGPMSVAVPRVTPS